MNDAPQSIHPSTRPESLLILLGLAASLTCIHLAGRRSAGAGEGIIHFDDRGPPGFTDLYF